MDEVRVKAKPTVSVKWERTAYFVFSLVLGFAPLANGVNPCGLAFLCAVPKKARLPAAAGCLLPALLTSGSVALELFCPIFLFGVMYFREKNGGVPFFTRILLAFSLSALQGAYVAMCGVEGITDVFRLIAAVAGYPAFTYGFSGFFDRKKELRRTAYEISLLVFAFAFSLSLKNAELGGTSLSILPGALFTLCAAKTRGFAYGGACGIVCGLVSGGAATGALGVLGMSYGMLASELEWAALTLSYMLAVSGHFYLAGTHGAISSAAMLALSFTLFIPMRKKLPVKKPEGAIDRRMQNKSISRYAAAFSSLSSLFYTVSETGKAESVTETNAKIVRIVSSFCERCEGCELEQSEISNFFTSEMRRKGVAAYSQIPLHISRRCPNAYAMARSVNNLPYLREKEGEQGLRRMAEEYSSFSSLLIDAARRQEETTRNDRALAERIKCSLLESGVECEGVKVTGTRMRGVSVFGVRPDRIKLSPNELASAISKATGTRMSTPEFVLHDGYTIMKSSTLPQFRVECAKCSQAKSGEAVCGDTVSVFENDDKYFYCLVSDGMGSGRDAALTSRLSAIMLEKLLSVGAEKESALKMLNKALIQSKGEVFATVDLLEIDRVLATATLIKAGAAPTILIRDGASKVLEAKTPPTGIMRQVIAEKKSFPIRKGDLLVMVSDGIMQTGGESPLPESGLPPFPSAQALASKLIGDAKRESRAADDMSVCVLRIY